MPTPPPGRAYTAASIQILEHIDAVRARPGMYIGGTGSDGFHHLLWEIVDNSCDEAQNGHASLVTVTLHADGLTCTVEDNGRGIPVDRHESGRNALEVVMTMLHAGAKFASGSYQASGGLHGVGAAAVNALSSKVAVRVRRDGQEWGQDYVRGRPSGPVAALGPARGTGTRTTFTPDPVVFGDLAFDAERVAQRLEVKAFLHRGLKLVFRDQVAGRTTEWKHEDGVADYLRTVIERSGVNRVVETGFTLERTVEDVEIALATGWTDAPRERVLSYVNGIPTPDGGTHEQGFRDALAKALRAFVDAHSLQPRGVTLTAEDLREGVVAVLAVRVREPQFQGQTKSRLNNPPVRGAVDAGVRQALEQWLHANRSVGEAIVARAVQAARARLAAREAEAGVRRKSATSTRLNLPGKLADCSSTDPEETELFLVEGDSAGGSAKSARDRRTQAVLPLRGKVLNAEQATLKKVLENEELNNVVIALGCGIGGDYRRERLRYGKLVLLMDADSDGHHITTLMLTFLYRFLPDLLRDGRVYLAQPPLYRIEVGKLTHWAVDDADRDRLLARLPARTKAEITRFKGLGEMPPKTLAETTLSPLTRRLLQVTVAAPIEADRMLADLMGKDVAPRYRFIMDRSAQVRADDLDV